MFSQRRLCVLPKVPRARRCAAARRGSRGRRIAPTSSRRALARREVHAMLSSPLAAPRLVGREDEIAFLLRLLEDALGHAPGSVALIDGEAGIGKTRLLAELRRRAADFGALTITVQAFEQVRDPYAPLVIAIARAIDQAAGRIAQHLRSVGSALDADAKLTKAKRLATVATGFRGMLLERPIGLFFEDLHCGRSGDKGSAVFLVKRASGGTVFRRRDAAA